MHLANVDLVAGKFDFVMMQINSGGSNQPRHGESCILAAGSRLREAKASAYRKGITAGSYDRFFREVSKQNSGQQLLRVRQLG